MPQVTRGLAADLPDQACHQRERRPAQAAAAGGGIGPQFDARAGERQEPHPGLDRVTEGQQPHAKPRGDHVLDQVEAVGPVGDAGGEAGHGREGADHVLVGGAAGVADPVTRPEAGEYLGRGAAAGGLACGHGQAPRSGPQRGRRDRRVDGDRGDVEVVDERQVGLVGGEKLEGLGGFVLADQHVDPRVAGGKAGDHRQQVAADRGGEPGDAQVAGRLPAGCQVAARLLDLGQDGHGALGQQAARGCQPDPPAVRFDQLGAHLAGESGELLRHRGGGGAERVRDRVHGPKPGQLGQQFKSPGFHALIVRLS